MERIASRRRGLAARATRGAILLLGLLAASAASARTVVVVKGCALVAGGPAPLVVMPTGEVLTAAQLQLGFGEIGFAPEDLLVHRLGGSFQQFDDFAAEDPMTALGNDSLVQRLVYEDGRLMGYGDYVSTHDVSSSLPTVLSCSNLVVLQSAFDFPTPGDPGGGGGDTTPPSLTVPADITLPASQPEGRPVAYVVSASDSVDPSPSVQCAPPSGSLFPVGTTTVACTARDFSGNTSRKSFAVTIVCEGNTIAGDVDEDCDVDDDDYQIVRAARNTPADGPDDRRDLDGDGQITALDMRKVVLACTRENCATESQAGEDPIDPIDCGLGAGIAPLAMLPLLRSARGRRERNRPDPGGTRT